MPAWQYQNARDAAEVAGSDDSNNAFASSNVAQNRDGSVLERTEYLIELMTLKTLTGTTDIDDSAQTESTAFPILTIAPATGYPIYDVEVVLDLHKATTGFGAVETSITVQAAVARKIDGTNWRREPYVEAALSGTNAANRAMKLNLGGVGVTEQARIYVLFSADVTSDMEIPYIINYRGISAPTITEVAA